MPGDWNADGVDTVGVKTATVWSLRNSNTFGSTEISFTFGGANDLPLTGGASRYRRERLLGERRQWRQLMSTMKPFAALRTTRNWQTPISTMTSR